MSAVGTALKSTAFDPSPNSYTRLTQPQSFQFKRNCIKKKNVLPRSAPFSDDPDKLHIHKQRLFCSGLLGKVAVTLSS